MARVILTDEFDNVVLKSDRPVLVDFFAEWCGPCKMLAPVIEELNGEYADKALIVKMDVDSNINISKTYDIKSIPTMIFFKNGEVADRVIGVVPKNEIVAKLNSLI